MTDMQWYAKDLCEKETIRKNNETVALPKSWADFGMERMDKSHIVK
jgi:hypothetical protein